MATVALLALLGGWIALQPRSSAPDLVVARDRLVAGDVVATFSPGAAEGYRFTLLRDGAWVWERTSGSDGSPLPDAIVFNGSDHLLRIDDACFIRLGAVKPPLVPGLTVARALTTQRGLDEQGGGRYAYTVDATAFSRTSAPASLRVTEDLSALRSNGAILVSTGEPPGPVWQGSYRLDRATQAEIERARRLVAGASPSDYAELVFRERVAGTLVLSSAVLGPYRIVVPEACPARATLLASGVQGGQAEGLRTAPSPLRFGPGDPATIERAKVTTLHIRAPVEAFNAAMEAGDLGSVPLTTTAVVVLRSNGGGVLAVEIVACTARPWFRC